MQNLYNFTFFKNEFCSLVIFLVNHCGKQLSSTELSETNGAFDPQFSFSISDLIPGIYHMVYQPRTASPNNPTFDRDVIGVVYIDV